MITSSDALNADSVSHSRFTFKRKISFKNNAASLKLILDKAEYLCKEEKEDDLLA